MPELIVTRGLPGCGKSTEANRWAEEDDFGRAVVGRDFIRTTVFRSTLPTFGASEDVVTVAQRALIGALLAHGISVCADDTNLPDHRIDAWREFADRNDARFTVWDMRNVPIDICIERDAHRAELGGRLVGADIIREMAAANAATWDRQEATRG